MCQVWGSLEVEVILLVTEEIASRELWQQVGGFLLILSGCHNEAFQWRCFLDKRCIDKDLLELRDKWNGQLPLPREVNRENQFSLLPAC